MSPCRQLLVITAALVLTSAWVYAQKSDYPITPVAFTSVHVTGGFWKERIDTVAKVTIPYAFDKCEQTGRINNFIFAGGLHDGKFQTRFGFDDSDVYKILEGACYSLMNQDDPALRARIETLIGYIGAAQESDGYLYTAWTLKANDYADMICCSYDPRGRFLGTQWSHELYNAGHMYEAAVAHYQATGEKRFLNIATKNADLLYHLCLEEGMTFYPGHQEIEIGLVKLYRVTGEDRYLQLARLFLDRRGQGLRTYENKGLNLSAYDIYAQDHKPVIDQRDAVGHAVRATYMYAAMADIAAIQNNQDYLHAIDAIWGNVVNKKLYVTGGLGAGNGIEGFDVDYALPNNAYAETCAAIANVLWNHRMFLLHGASKYIDVMERTLYNGLIAGLSLDGDTFFYPNPLEFDGKGKFNQGAVCRSPWFDCSCCPSNLCRFIPSVSGYAYAHTASELYVNLFMENHATIDFNGRKLVVDQSTSYPWDGTVRLSIGNEQPVPANILIRIPGWAGNEPVPGDLYRFTGAARQKTQIRVNGKPVTYEIVNGYAVVKGDWKRGDIIQVDFPMEIRTIRANEQIEADRGKVAIQRGPIVYCAEGVDNEGRALEVQLGPDASFSAKYHANLLDGVSMLSGQGWVTESAGRRAVPVHMVPYCVWGHRGQGEMAVWLNGE